MKSKLLYISSVFRILILRVPSVNRIFPLRLLTAGAISLFLNITGAIAPVAPVLNTPLLMHQFQIYHLLNSKQSKSSVSSISKDVLEQRHKVLCIFLFLMTSDFRVVTKSSGRVKDTTFPNLSI